MITRNDETILPLSHYRVELYENYWTLTDEAGITVPYQYGVNRVDVNETFLVIIFLLLVGYIILPIVQWVLYILVVVLDYIIPPLRMSPWLIGVTEGFHTCVYRLSSGKVNLRNYDLIFYFILAFLH